MSAAVSKLLIRCLLFSRYVLSNAYFKYHLPMQCLKPFFFCLLLPLGVMPVPLLGLPVSGLYSYEVAVANQSDQERSRAFREALAAVIVKVTGEQRWLENAGIQEALQNSGNFVEAIEYRTESRPPAPEELALLADPAPEPLSAAAYIDQELLNVSFARDLIDQLLARAAIPVWDSNRPSVLVWMALQNDAGERNLLSQESDPGIMDLNAALRRRSGHSYSVSSARF